MKVWNEQVGMIKVFYGLDKYLQIHSVMIQQQLCHDHYFQILAILSFTISAGKGWDSDGDIN